MNCVRYTSLEGPGGRALESHRIDGLRLSHAFYGCGKLFNEIRPQHLQKRTTVAEQLGGPLQSG